MYIKNIKLKDFRNYGALEINFNSKVNFILGRNAQGKTNLLESIDDVLVRAGVLKDDHSGIIVSHDGSRVLYDKDNPRTVLFIREMEDMDATTRDARM